MYIKKTYPFASSSPSLTLQRPSSPAAAHQRPASSPTLARFVEHERDSWRWRGGVVGEWAALPHPSAAHSPPRRRPFPPRQPSSPHLDSHGAPRPPPPTVAAEPSPVPVVLVRATGAGARWCSRAAARRRLPPRRPESTGLGLFPPMLQMYVSIVSDVSEICCNCFIWMLRK